jgi:hypothetical protein
VGVGASKLVVRAGGVTVMPALLTVLLLVFFSVTV